MDELSMGIYCWEDQYEILSLFKNYYHSRVDKMTSPKNHQTSRESSNFMDTLNKNSIEWWKLIKEASKKWM